VAAVQAGKPGRQYNVNCAQFTGRTPVASRGGPNILIFGRSSHFQSAPAHVPLTAGTGARTWLAVVRKDMESATRECKCLSSATLAGRRLAAAQHK